MRKQNTRSRKSRMIHIRLDDKTHRDLKLYAVANDTTVQSVVEDLIRDMLSNQRIITKKVSTGKRGK